MNLHIYRYGEGVRKRGLYVGAARYLPRGVRREAYARDGYFDVWVPELAPSAGLIRSYRGGKITFAKFAQKYRAEMRSPSSRQVIRLLAAAANHQAIHLGCYCADPEKCHRSVLRKLVIDAEEELPKRSAEGGKYFSPACSMPEIEDS